MGMGSAKRHATYDDKVDVGPSQWQQPKLVSDGVVEPPEPKSQIITTTRTCPKAKVQRYLDRENKNRRGAKPPGRTKSYPNITILG